LNETPLAPAATASSALSSTAYVYPVFGGNSAGIAARPVDPTVYSVARTVSDGGAAPVQTPATQVPCAHVSADIPDEHVVAGAPEPPHAPYVRLDVVPAGKKILAVCGAVGLTGGPPSRPFRSAGSVMVEPCAACQDAPDIAIDVAFGSTGVM
jgi:hypothetical protein